LPEQIHRVREWRGRDPASPLSNLNAIGHRGNVMRKSASTCIAATFVALAGCSYDPHYQDPLAKLTNVPAASVPLDVPVRVEQPVALVPSENSAAIIQAAHEAAEALAPWRGIISDHIWAEGDPQYMLNAAVAVLRRRYPQIVLLDDLATARQRGMRTAFVLDIQVHHLTSAFDTNTVDILLIALDANQRPVSRFVGHGTSSTNYGSMDPHFDQAVVRAVQDFDAKAGQLLN
jgi:hypothetical protein